MEIRVRVRVDLFAGVCAFDSSLIIFGETASCFGKLSSIQMITSLGGDVKPLTKSPNLC